MNFAHPWWLMVGAIAAGALLWTWRVVDARRRAALEQFLAPQLRVQLTQSISGARAVAKRCLFAAAVVLLFVALAEPQAGYRWEQVKRRGNDIIFAVDTSRSMSTPDVKPNRLARAKLAIDDFVGRLNGDAVGLVAFAGSAFLQCPITLDYGAFHESLAALDTHIIPRGGTDITSAIHEAEAALQRRPGSDKTLILVTDGEDLEGDSLAAAKAAAAQDGLKIFTVGVGSANGDLIPLPADQGGGFLRDRNGQLVKSHLDEPALQALAAATGGIYAPLGAANQGLDTIYQAALAPLAKHDLASKSQKVYTQRFQWPLGISLALLMASLMPGTRRGGAPAQPAAQPRSAQRAPSTQRTIKRFALPTSAGMAVALCWLLPMHTARASTASAASAYSQGNFTKAEQEYLAAAQSNPKQPTLQFDAGTAAYKAGEFTQAAKAFQASVDTEKSGSAKRLGEQEDAYYNLGNTLYREGQKTVGADPQKTIQDWTQAVKVYDAALQLRTDDADTKFNRDLVNRKLEALKKAQSQQKNQSQQNQSKKDQSKQGQSKQDQSKQGQSAQDQSKPQSGQGPQSKDTSGKGNTPLQANQPQQQQQSPQQQAQAGQPKPQPGQSQASQPQPNGQPQLGPQPPQQARQQPGQQPDKEPGNAGQGNAYPPAVPPAANGSQPRPDRGQGAGETRGEQTAQADDDQRQPGGMSRQEARDLLDSVKDELRQPPTAPVARNSANDTAPDEPLKDW